MLANRKISSTDESRNYLSSNNALGAGLHVGFQTNLSGNFYVSTSVQMLNLRNSVNVDLVKSGFYNPTNSKYDKNQSYSMGNINAIGISLAAGYNFKLTANKKIRVAAGLHAQAAKLKPGGGLLATSGSYIGTPSGIPIYKEQLNGGRSNATLFGLDLMANYVLTINRTSCFIGLHYAQNLGSNIRGQYVTFPNFSMSDSGAFKLSTNYLGLTIGFALPIRKSKQQ
jgi:hypothetical protein